jgi:hypothetical protein
LEGSKSEPVPLKVKVPLGQDFPTLFPFVFLQAALFKIVNQDPLASLLEDAIEEFDMQRVGLILVLRFLVGKDDVERDLVGLIDDRAGAGGHFPGVKMQAARNGAQIFFDSRQEFFGRLGLGRVCPEYDNV